MHPRIVCTLIVAFIAITAAAVGHAAGHANSGPAAGHGQTKEAAGQAAPLRLGNFSVSLAVKDLGASRAFYETLGFSVVGGDAARNWLILQNETATIGLFQGMFDKNILTFNPGWDRASRTLPEFDDVRHIQAALKARGVTPVLEADGASTGPASFMIVDPDGNQILIDQHVPKPGK